MGFKYKISKYQHRLFAYNKYVIYKRYLLIRENDIKLKIMAVLFNLIVNYFNYHEIESWYEFCYVLTFTCNI